MKVLLADDEPIARTMLEHWLVGWGYESVCVRDGAAALTALEADPEIRLAILDWVMPEFDGIDVVRQMRAAEGHPYVYMILLTARDNKDDIIGGLEAGADDYLIKPCNPLELKVRITAGRRVVDLQRELTDAHEALRIESMTDTLTGVLNRKAVLELLGREMSRAERSGEPVSLLMTDLDRFKSINDQFGHAVGDAVLIESALRLKQGVRAYDSLGRIGGEELIVVLPRCDRRDGVLVAQRLKWLLSNTPVNLKSGRSLSVTASFGLATTELRPNASADELLHAADTAMYRAKKNGRNRVEFATEADWPEQESPIHASGERSAAASSLCSAHDLQALSDLKADSA